MSFKNKVVDNELDLSLNQLTDVPVKELLATPKATHLDISNNLLQSLPNDFVLLKHLVHLDLSRNQLKELPENFGNLINLEYLDLEKNQLTTVPISFSRLKNLRWLDLKDNLIVHTSLRPMTECLNEKDCQKCAKQVVDFMKKIESDLEREKQKKLKESREIKAAEKAKMDKEIEEQRRLKKLEKEKKKAESKARQVENQSRQNAEKASSHNEKETSDDGRRIVVEKQGINWCKWILMVFFLSCVSAAGFAAYFIATSPNTRLRNFSWQDVQILMNLGFSEITRSASHFFKVIIPFLYDAKAFLLRQIHASMISLSKLATDIELLLSVYF